MNRHYQGKTNENLIVVSAL